MVLGSRTTIHMPFLRNSGDSLCMDVFYKHAGPTGLRSQNPSPDNDIVRGIGWP
jgi:hypothetical protein